MLINDAFKKMFLDKIGNFETFESFDVTDELFPLSELWNFQIKSVVLELEILDFREYVRIKKVSKNDENFENFKNFENFQNLIDGTRLNSDELETRRKKSFLTRKITVTHRIIIFTEIWLFYVISLFWKYFKRILNV